MAKRYELRRGDMCPCCGQKIETDDQTVLDTLTSFAKTLSDRGSIENENGWLHLVGFSWPEEDKA